MKGFFNNYLCFFFNLFFFLYIFFIFLSFCFFAIYYLRINKKKIYNTNNFFFYAFKNINIFFISKINSSTDHFLFIFLMFFFFQQYKCFLFCFYISILSINIFHLSFVKLNELIFIFIHFKIYLMRALMACLIEINRRKNVTIKIVANIIERVSSLCVYRIWVPLNFLSNPCPVLWKTYMIITFFNVGLAVL